MDNLKTTLQNLRPLDRQMLMLAFEKGMAKIVVLQGKLFIGVNATGIPGVKILEQQGDFIMGELP